MEPKPLTVAEEPEAVRSLHTLEPSRPHSFIPPVKKINDGQDVSSFLTSRAYVDIGTFVMQLNLSMCPRKLEINGKAQIKTWELGSSDIVFPEAVQKIQTMLEVINSITDEVPPDTGPRRFGNISFRKWYEVLESRIPNLLKDYLSVNILNFRSAGEATSVDELTAYLMGSFGSSQRLDYGTGHELSFLAFLGCLWKLGAFGTESQTLSVSDVGRSIVLGIVEP
jgi:serine/threonine-protein phosphatase 2A activator